jgi:hypothetical protein
VRIPPRPDLAALVVVVVAVLAITACALLRVPPPDVLQYVAVTALGIAGGTALNAANSPASESAAQRIADAVEGIKGLTRQASAPAPRYRAPAPADVAPAPRPAPASTEVTA